MYGLLTYEDYHLSTLCSCMINYNLSSKQQNTTTPQFARQDKKKLKAFQYFKEGQIRRTHISAKGGITYVKGEVLVSMKQQKFKVMISMNHLGEALKAACQCPAG